MNPRPSYLLPLLVLALGIASLTLPGRAQEAPSARFAFSDTTLLRDTLDLKFDLLFPLADSLRIDPQQLRELAIRYRMPLRRLVHLSDSLRLPVDSVGAVMERERFNPLIATAERISAFSYNSTYQVGREGRAVWGNGAEYVFSVGGIHARNVTNVSIDRFRGDLQTLTRASETEVNLRYSKDFSLGGRVSLLRNVGYQAIGRSVSSNSEYQVTMRTTQRPRPSLRSGVNLFLGPFSEPESPGLGAKRGVSSQLNGNLEYNHRGWLIYNLDGRLTGRFGRGRLPERPWLGIQELFGNARGTLSLYERTPVSVRFTHGLTRNRAENPDTTIFSSDTGRDTAYFLRRLPSGGREASLALNLRGGRGSLTVTGNLRDSDRLLKIGGINRSSSSYSTGLDVDGRYALAGWSLNARFSSSGSATEDPLRRTSTRITATGETTLVVIDYRQKTETPNRSLDVSFDRLLTSKLSIRGRGRVYLSSSRFSITDSSYRGRPGVGDLRVAPNEPRDTYEDGLEISGVYNPSTRLSTSLALELSTKDNINLLGSSSSSNNHVRTYRALWSWTYRLMAGLTATQRDQLTADYTYYPFAGSLNQLAMRFDVRTTLNASVTPRFRVDLTHATDEQPRGSYVEGPDGRSLFRVNNRTRNYNLSSSISYSPVPSLSLSLNPSYRADGSGGGIGLRKSLDFSGGASVNLDVGRTGKLTGSMARTYSVRTGSPERYSWSGSLSLSWQVQ